MGDSELPVAQIKAAPPPRYFNGLLNVSSSIYEENLEASTTKKALTPYYAILLERTRAIFGAVLDAKSHPDREALSRKLWSQDDERGRIMKVVLTQAERTIARDICIGYGFEDRGRIEAAAWGLSYTLETRVASVKSDGDEGPPRQAFLSCLLNTDLGRAAA
jgi:hypothetical protein